MSKSKRNIPSNFQSKEEAFEYLIEQSQKKALKDQWKAELDQLPDAPLEKNGVIKRLFNKKAVAIAASFIILLGSFYWVTNRESSLHQMAEVMLMDTKFIMESGFATRGVIDEETDSLAIELQKEINKSIENEDYEASVGLFSTKEKKSQLTAGDKFYYSLSLARVESGDHYKAIRMLDDVITQNDKYYNEALWLQALLYLKINEPNKSKIILNKLINNSNYQITNTKALLERMAD